MNNPLARIIPLAAAGAIAVCGIAACSSGASAPASVTKPPAATTRVAGTIVDEIVINATVTAYSVSSTGVVGACIPATPATTPASCATGSSDANGDYRIDLGSYSGAVLLQTTGGSYTDIGTGQTVPLPSGLTLSALLPAVAPGSSTITAQITPLTTVVAQLALQRAAQGTALATAAQTLDTTVGAYFGGLSNLVGTALVDLGQASCGPAGTSQATYDASLVLAGIAELAAQSKVNTADLVLAIVQDVASDGVFDGLAAGVPISVPLAAGGGSVALTTIYGSGLAQSLAAAIPVFEASVANACKASASSGAINALAKAPSPQMSSAEYQYTLNGTYTLGSQINTSFQLKMTLGLTCSVDVPMPTTSGPPQHSINPTTGSQQPFQLVIGGTPTSYASFDWSNACGNNTWTLSIVNSLGQTCGFLPGNTTSGTFSSTMNGDVNTATLPTNLALTCTTNFFSVGGTVSGLQAGQSLTLADTANGTTILVNANGSFVIDTNLASNAPYNVTSSAANCTVTNGGGTVQNANVSNVTVVCMQAGGTPDALNSPQGLAFHNNQLYAANAGGNQVLIFSEQLNGQTVTGLTQIGRITADINDPVRLAFDAAGFLYVANLGSGTVTVYDTNHGNAEVTAAGGGPIISGLIKPMGVAVDGKGNLYVASNSGNDIAVYVPTTAGNPATGYAAPVVLSADASGNAFLAPGVLYEYDLSSLIGAGNDYLLAGLGPNSAPDSVILYKVPFTSAPSPIYDLTNASCPTMPSGPTGIAFYPQLTNPQASFIYITSYYNGNVTQYQATSFFSGLTLGGGSTNPCPTPLTTATGINAPEGVSVDAQGNVFISNAATSGTNANTIVAFPGGWSTNNTAPSAIYHYP